MEIVAAKVIVPAAARRAESPARGEFSRGLVDHGHFRLGNNPHAALRDPAADARAKKLFLAHEGEGPRWHSRPRLQRGFVDREHQLDLLVGGTRNGSAFIGMSQRSWVNRQLLQHELAQLQWLRGAGHVERPQRGGAHLVLRGQGTARVAPRAVQQHAHGKARAEAGGRFLQPVLLHLKILTFGSGTTAGPRSSRPLLGQVQGHIGQVQFAGQVELVRDCNRRLAVRTEEEGRGEQRGAGATSHRAKKRTAIHPKTLRLSHGKVKAAAVTNT